MHTYNDFSFNFASTFLQNRARETACVSPVSLLLPLAAVASASEGGTRGEFAEVLGNSAHDPQRLLYEMHEICDTLNACSAVRELTNTIIGAKDHAFLPVFTENMHRAFGNKIGMKQGQSDSILLTNITHFKEDWVTRFAERKERFYKTPHGVEEHGEITPFLYYEEEALGYTKNEDYQSVTVPFRKQQSNTSACYMTFSMPFNRSIDKVFASPEKIKEMLRCQSEHSARKVELHLPAFSLKKEYDLNNDLMKIGLKQAFKEADAEFPYMVLTKPDENVYMESVRQEIKVDVTAQGAEARAVTIIKMGVCTISMPMKLPTFPKEILCLNHPFLFAIWLKTPSGDALPLFIGAKR